MQDQTINSLKETVVKGDEKIKWSLSADWLAELIKHLDLYLSFSRHKSPNHLLLATNLKKLTSNAANMDTILRSLREKPNLKKFGWNRNQSYLFTLCDIASQLYAYSQMLAQEKQKLEQANAQMILDLKQQCDDKDKYIENLQTQAAEDSAVAIEAVKTANYWREQHKELQESKSKLIEQHNKTCEEKEQQFKSAQKNYASSVYEINVLKEDKKSLAAQLDQTKQELTQLQKLFAFVKKWVDQLFGDSFELKPSEILAQGKGPKLAENQEQLIRTIIKANPPQILPLSETDLQQTTAIEPTSGPSFFK